MNNFDFDREVGFEIVEHIGIITKHSTGWRKELNLVSWNRGPVKYDIRDWDPLHEHMSKGVTLHPKEAREICRMLEEHFAKSESPEE